MNHEPLKIDEILEVKNVERLELGPADILVVTVDCPVSHETMERIKHQLQPIVGDDRKILVVERLMKFGVIRNIE